MLESGAHIEAKNTTVIEMILLYTKIPQIRLEKRNTCRTDDAFHDACLADVYDGMMTIAMQEMPTNVRHSHSPLAQDGRSPLMSVIKRDMPKPDKAAMVKLLLYRKADMFAEDNVSAGRMSMCQDVN